MSGTEVQLPHDKQKLTEEIEDTKDFDDKVLEGAIGRSGGQNSRPHM